MFKQGAFVLMSAAVVGLAGAAEAATVVNSTVGVSEWGTIQFTHGGGDLNIDILASGWTGGLTGLGIDDPFLTLLLDDGSPLTAFTGAFVAFNDDYFGTDGDGSTSALDSFLSLPSLASGNYLLTISHCCVPFGGDVNQDSGIHDDGFGNVLGDFQITFSQDVTLRAVNGVLTEPPESVPEPASTLAVLVGAAAAGGALKKKQAV